MAPSRSSARELAGDRRRARSARRAIPRRRARAPAGAALSSRAACASLASASRNATRCRSRARNAPSMSSCAPASARMSRRRSSTPSPVFADSHTCRRCVASPSSRNSLAAATPARSILLWTTIRGSAARQTRRGSRHRRRRSSARLARRRAPARDPRARRPPTCARCRAPRSDRRWRASPAVSTIVSGMPCDLDRALDGVARRARDRRDDRNLVAGEPVEQARLADVRARRPAPRRVRRAGARPGARAAAICARAAADGRELALRVGGTQEIDVLVGKIERRLGEHPQLDERVGERAHLARELAREAARRRARRRRRRGVDQIGDALRLREVELAIEKCALREFARLREPRAEVDAPRQARGAARPGRRDPAIRGPARRCTSAAPGSGARGLRRAARPASPRNAASVAAAAAARARRRPRSPRRTPRPETRTMPMPPRPGGVAMAAIVSTGEGMPQDYRTPAARFAVTRVFASGASPRPRRLPSRAAGSCATAGRSGCSC